MLRAIVALMIFSLYVGAADYNVVRAIAGVTAEAVTVQQVANSNRILHFKTAYVECTVACTVTVERNGSAATSTEATPTPVNATSEAAVSKAFVASNVGSGTAISPAYSVAANGSIVLDMTAVYLYTAVTTDNVSIKIASASGNYKVLIQYEETSR